MTKQIWFNLPVKNVAKSRAFFTALGFKLNEHFGNNDNMTSFLIGEHNICLMLCDESTFKGFTKNEIIDTKKGTEVLFSIDAESRAEVDEITQKAEKAGGKIFAEPGENQGWMYGSGFCDLDGHRWNVLYMDFSKMPK